ncbi:MAG: hypothetical protein IIX27_07875 [Ruminococcus sp.]|nr:hypothetical protein [Ruminococcus sp.]
MKKTLRILLVIAVFVMITCAFSITAYAAGDVNRFNPLPKSTAFFIVENIILKTIAKVLQFINTNNFCC